MTKAIYSVFATVVATLVITGPVRGETLRPAQSVAANALPLIHLPAPSNPASVCIVDKGVDLNPDTQHAVVARISPNLNTPVHDTSKDKHGTTMASVIAAPPNGWGMVGTWPAAKIISSHHGGYFPNGMSECLNNRARYNIRVIELALGVPGMIPGDDWELQNAILTAQRDGVNIVAAAGNIPGPLGAPANHLGVFAVGGIDYQGQLWRTPDGKGGSAYGPELALVALSTGLDMAFPDGRPSRGHGTSGASAFVAAVLTALRSYCPDLSAGQAEQLLTSTATATPGGPALNVETAFRAAGLGAQWEVAARQVPPPVPVEPPVQSASPVPSQSQEDGRVHREQLPRPKVRAKRGKKGLVIRVGNRPRGAVLVVSVRVRGRMKVLKRVRKNVAVVRCKRGLRVVVRYRLGQRWSRVQAFRK